MLIVVAGPTAVGKTAVAIQLAKHFSTEIISADSRQVFREMNIGTAKPSEAELASVPHHLINHRSIHEKYDAAAYGMEALQVLQDLFRTHDQLILCGGSGLYIKAVCEGFDDIPPVADEIRKALMEQYQQQGLQCLQQKMIELDPDYFAVVDSHNPHRLLRALEVKIGTGQSISTFHKKNTTGRSFVIKKIGLELPREELYHRIDARMDEMIRTGLFKEATALYPFKNHQALQTVGYQEIFDFIDGAHNRDETIRLLKQNSRRYAKRQMTWFRRDKEMHWFNANSIHTIIAWLNGFELDGCVEPDVKN